MISQELIIASLLIIEAILNPFSAASMYSGRKYFSILFHVKKCTLYFIKYGSAADNVNQFYIELIKMNLKKRFVNFCKKNYYHVPWTKSNA